MSELDRDIPTADDTHVMEAPPADERVDDPRLFAAVEEYMKALEAGRRPHRREFLARYPDIADELAACLEGLALLQCAADEIPAVPSAETGLEKELNGGEPLGDFRLVREIGRGGMGVVYEAVQLSLGRRVALKVLPFAAALDARHLERFRNEAQAAARLHHTNIVPVYAVGCERSVHFYAMQLIEGQSLAEVIRSLRDIANTDESIGRSQVSKSKATPSRRSDSIQNDRTAGPPSYPGAGLTPSLPISTQNLSTLRSSKGSAYVRSVASLGLQVAEALDYAHRGGIVHRDIKPANLLLDGKGTLWVTDFGLAQFYQQPDLTRTGDLLGTLRYMSPEQASGRAVVLDQRTDIYSLGTTLYELLTLQRAIPGETHEALLYQVAHVDPKPARSIDKTIPRELEIVLAKAMAKEPGDRYATARAMADDLKRFLLDEPILAKPPSLRDRAWKWTRRHKVWALAGVVALTLSTAVLLISTLAIAREQANTRRAYQAEQQKSLEASQQRARAERSWAEAREAVDFFSTVAIGMDRPEFSEVRRDLLEESLAYYQQFLEERRGDASVGAELASAEARVTTFLELYAALDAGVRASYRLSLLRESSVRDDLKLTPAQASAALALTSQFSGMPPRSATTTTPTTISDDRKRQFSEMAKQIDAAIDQTLGTQAAVRLRQISRQVRGAAAFSDPDIVELLELSREQRSKIRNIQVQSRNRTGGRGGPDDSRFPRARQSRPDSPPDETDESPVSGERDFNSTNNAPHDAVAQIIAVLTPSQVITWAALTGPPFMGHVSSHGPGGMFGGMRGGPNDDGFGGPNHELPAGD